jgi:hypothetical protein
MDAYLTFGMLIVAAGDPGHMPAQPLTWAQECAIDEGMELFEHAYGNGQPMF